MTGAPAESAYLGIMQMEATVRQDFALEIFIFLNICKVKLHNPIVSFMCLWVQFSVLSLVYALMQHKGTQTQLRFATVVFQNVK